MSSSSSVTDGSSSRQKPEKTDRIIIIGAGVFGLGTARELVKRGYINVSVLDRFPPPALDGSSVDISRVIRPDYADDFYAKLGFEALEGWKTEYSPYFYKCGMLFATQDLRHPYLDEAKNNLQRLGKKVDSFEGNEARQRYPAIHGDLSKARGYSNPVAGWANAEGSVLYLARQCALAGVSFISGPRGTVTSFLTDGRQVVGVQTMSGIPIHGDRIIVATGAWTPHLMNMSRTSVSNSQPVGYMQLTSEEAKELEGCPVILDLSTGWFAFPPTPGTNILKMARHGYGYEIARRSHSQGTTISAPEIDNDNSSSTFIPDGAERALREGLALFLPRFKDRKFIRRRLCWYTDTPKGDFIVDYHADYSNLFMATGGSGHAFKFLPVLGRYVADAFEMQASQQQNAKWAWNPSAGGVSKGDGSRGGPPRRTLSREEQARL